MAKSAISEFIEDVRPPVIRLNDLRWSLMRLGRDRITRDDLKMAQSYLEQRGIESEIGHRTIHVLSLDMKDGRPFQGGFYSTRLEVSSTYHQNGRTASAGQPEIEWTNFHTVVEQPPYWHSSLEDVSIWARQNMNRISAIGQDHPGDDWWVGQNLQFGEFEYLDLYFDDDGVEREVLLNYRMVIRRFDEEPLSKREAAYLCQSIGCNPIPGCHDAQVGLF